MSSITIISAGRCTAMPCARRRSLTEIPGSFETLVNDPSAPLAGALLRIGGLAEDTTPFGEFAWADFLRRRIKRKQVASTAH
jgi:hypothetical protein